MDLPRELGYDDGAPVWWPLPVLALAGLVAAFAIVRLPGHGGHSPAGGLATGSRPSRSSCRACCSRPRRRSASGVVLGPEAPLIALGSGLGDPRGRAGPARCARPGARRGRRRRQLRGGLVHLRVTAGRRRHSDRGRRAGPPPPDGARPGRPARRRDRLARVDRHGVVDRAELGGLRARTAGAAELRPAGRRRVRVDDPAGGRRRRGRVRDLHRAQALEPVLERRRFVLLPAAGLVVAGLAIAFSQATDKGVEQVLFSGQEQLPGLVEGAGTWSVSAWRC